MEGTALLGRLSWQLAEVVATRAETARARSITFAVASWPGHRAGQHVDLRLTAEEELSDTHITDVIGAALDTDTTDVLDESTSTHGGITVISFEVSDASQTEPTISRLNFLRAGGRTWELGCQSDITGADTINEACDQMLDTLTLVEDE